MSSVFRLMGSTALPGERKCYRSVRTCKLDKARTGFLSGSRHSLTKIQCFKGKGDDDSNQDTVDKAGDAGQHVKASSPRSPEPNATVYADATSSEQEDHPQGETKKKKRNKSKPSSVEGQLQEPDTASETQKRKRSRKSKQAEPPPTQGEQVNGEAEKPNDQVQVAELSDLAETTVESSAQQQSQQQKRKPVLGRPETLQVVEAFADWHAKQLETAVPAGKVNKAALDSGDLMDNPDVLASLDELQQLQSMDECQASSETADLTLQDCASFLKTQDLHVSAAAVTGGIADFSSSKTTTIKTQVDAHAANVTADSVKDAELSKSDESAQKSVSVSETTASTSRDAVQLEVGGAPSETTNTSTTQITENDVDSERGGASSESTETKPTDLSENDADSKVKQQAAAVIEEMRKDLAADEPLDWSALCDPSEVSSPVDSAALDWPYDQQHGTQAGSPAGNLDSPATTDGASSQKGEVTQEPSKLEGSVPKPSAMSDSDAMLADQTSMVANNIVNLVQPSKSPATTPASAQPVTLSDSDAMLLEGDSSAAASTAVSDSAQGPAAMTDSDTVNQQAGPRLELGSVAADIASVAKEGEEPRQQGTVAVGHEKNNATRAEAASNAPETANKPPTAISATPDVCSSEQVEEVGEDEGDGEGSAEEAAAKEEILELLQHPKEVIQEMRDQPWGAGVSPDYVMGLVEAVTHPDDSLAAGSNTGAVNLAPGQQPMPDPSAMPANEQDTPSITATNLSVDGTTVSNKETHASRVPAPDVPAPSPSPGAVTDDDGLGLGRPAGSPEPVTAGELLQQLHASTPEVDPFTAGLHGKSGAMEEDQTRARSQGIETFSQSTGLDSLEFLEALNEPHPCSGCADDTEEDEAAGAKRSKIDGAKYTELINGIADSEQQTEATDKQHQQPDADVPPQNPSATKQTDKEEQSETDQGNETEPDEATSLKQAMQEAREAIEQQRQQEAATAAASGAGNESGGATGPSPAVLAAEARLMLLTAMAGEVKAVRAEVQQVVSLLKDLKQALSLAQQADLPAETATSLQQSILSEMARLGVELQSATMGMSTLACAMSHVQRSSSLPALTSVEQYMQYIENVAADLDNSTTQEFPDLAAVLLPQKGGKDTSTDTPLASSFMKTAEKLRDQVDKSLREGANVDAIAVTARPTSSACEERKEHINAIQGDEVTDGAGAEEGDGNTHMEIRMTRLSQQLLSLARERVGWQQPAAPLNDSAATEDVANSVEEARVTSALGDNSSKQPTEDLSSANDQSILNSGQHKTQAQSGPSAQQSSTNDGGEPLGDDIAGMNDNKEPDVFASTVGKGARDMGNIVGGGGGGSAKPPRPTARGSGGNDDDDNDSNKPTPNVPNSRIAAVLFSCAAVSLGGLGYLYYTDHPFLHRITHGQHSNFSLTDKLQGLVGNTNPISSHAISTDADALVQQPHVTQPHVMQPHLMQRDTNEPLGNAVQEGQVGEASAVGPDVNGDNGSSTPLHVPYHQEHGLVSKLTPLGKHRHHYDEQELVVHGLREPDLSAMHPAAETPDADKGEQNNQAGEKQQENAVMMHQHSDVDDSGSYKQDHSHDVYSMHTHGKAGAALPGLVAVQEAGHQTDGDAKPRLRFWGKALRQAHNGTVAIGRGFGWLKSRVTGTAKAMREGVKDPEGLIIMGSTAAAVVGVGRPFQKRVESDSGSSRGIADAPAGPTKSSRNSSQGGAT